MLGSGVREKNKRDPLLLCTPFHLHHLEAATFNDVIRTIDDSTKIYRSYLVRSLFSRISSTILWCVGDGFWRGFSVIFPATMENKQRIKPPMT
jgi:hypothetical protein